MDRRLDQLNNLKCFECAARHNSYSKAAEELCLSQAAVSQKMRQLEANLNTKLFVRKGKQMLLTQSGEKLFDASQTAFSILINSFNHINSESVAGNLVITSTSAFTSLWLMPRLHRFISIHPEITIEIASSSKFENLALSHIDLAIRFSNNLISCDEKELVAEYFGEDNIYPVCSAKLAEEIEFGQSNDILKSWLVKLKNEGPFSWQRWFENAKVQEANKHQKWTEVASTDIGLSAVKSGHGITLAAESLFSQSLADSSLVIPIKVKHPESVKRFFVYDPNSAKSKRLKIFMDWVKSEMEQGKVEIKDK